MNLLLNKFSATTGYNTVIYYAIKTEIQPNKNIWFHPKLLVWIEYFQLKRVSIEFLCYPLIELMLESVYWWFWYCYQAWLQYIPLIKLQIELGTKLDIFFTITMNAIRTAIESENTWILI